MITPYTYILSCDWLSACRMMFTIFRQDYVMAAKVLSHGNQGIRVFA